MIRMATLPNAVVILLERIEKAGFEGYAVGGCVRDMLLQKAPHDYDITTSATPDEVKAIFSDLRVIETGIQHGTVTVLLDDEPYEITTYRLETTYSDSRHPDAVYFSKTLSDDLCRRDFTVNAMAMGKDGRVVDLYEGEENLKKGLIRCVGDPRERFSEDALRILRALRFASVLDFEIEDKTLEAAYDLRENLHKVSAERIAVELNKLLLGRGVFRVLTKYVDILGAVIPELLPMKDFDQHNYHHAYDVLTHTAKAVEAIPPVKHLRLAALFHDIGKPSTFSIGEDGVGHFYSHASVSRDMTEEILIRLKYDNKTKDAVISLVKWHDHVIEASESVIKRMLSRMSDEAFFDLLHLKRADNLGQHPDYFFRQKEIDEIEAMAKDILARQECLSLKDLTVKGRDLIAMGYSVGRRIGEILTALLNEVLCGNLPNEKGALLYFVQENFKIN